MADRQFYRPSNRKEEDDGMYDDSWKSSAASQSESIHAASNKASSTLDDIDDLLNDHDSDSSSSSSSGSNTSDESSGSTDPATTSNTPENLKSQEENPDKPGTQDKNTSAETKDEAHALNYSGKGGNQKQQNGFWNKNRAKKAGILGGTLAVGGVAGMMGLSSLFSGLGMVVTVGQGLSHSFSHNDKQESVHMGDMFKAYRFFKTGDIAQTRLSSIGAKVFDTTLKQMSDAGLTFERDKLTGRPLNLQIDEKKLSAKLQEQGNNYSSREDIAKKLGVDPAKMTDVGGGKIQVDLKGQNIRSLRLLTHTSVGLLDSPVGLGTLKSLYLKQAFRLPNAFHVFKKAQINAEQKAIDAAREKLKKKGKTPAEAEAQAKTEAANQAESDAKKATVKPFEESAKAASEKVKSAKNSFTSTVAKSITFTGAACIVRNVAGEIAQVNRDVVKLPAAAMATRYVAAAAQVKYGGKDVDLEQVGALQRTFYDKQGNSILQGKAFQKLLDPSSNPKGPDLPGQYQQAFNGQSTAANIQAGADEVVEKSMGLGGVVSADVLCSTPSLLLQGGLVLGLSFGAEVLSGGTATPAVAGLWALNAVKSGIVSMVVYGAVIHLIESIATDSQLPEEVFQGPVGGDLLAYGSRAAANISAVSDGGVDLGNVDSTLDVGDYTDDSLGYTSEPRSIATRLLDRNDPKSLMSRMAMSYYTSNLNTNNPVHSAANLATTFTNIGNLFSRTFSSLIPRAAAAEAGNYQWGFAQFGIPDGMMNDPELADWQTNGSIVSGVLDGPSGSKYIDKAKACFGATLTKGSDGWDVVKGDMVDTSSLEYTKADCKERSSEGGVDPTMWRRTIMFIYDTNTIKDGACVTGIDESVCPGASTAAAPATNPATTASQQNGQGVQLDGVSDLIVSNQFTDATEIIPKVTNIVIHWIDSNPESPEEVHAGLASTGTSVQFYVSQSGKIMQLTPFANSKAKHAKNANDFAIGIEIGSPNAESIGDSPPYHKLEDALISNTTQKAQVIKLATALAKKFGITSVTVGNQTLYTPGDTCAALGLSFPGTCATQAEAAPFGIVGHYQLQDTKADPGPTYVTQIQQGVKSNLGL